jgi:hypothetical protein
MTALDHDGDMSARSLVVEIIKPALVGGSGQATHV